MGCSHSKIVKKRQESKRPMEDDKRRDKEICCRKEEEMKTCKEMKSRRKEKKFVWRKNEVTPLPTDPPNFEKSEKRQEKSRDTDLKASAKKDKEAFLADRKLDQARRRQLIWRSDDDDTLFEQPTRMKDIDFTEDLFSTTSTA